MTTVSISIRFFVLNITTVSISECFLYLKNDYTLYFFIHKMPVENLIYPLQFLFLNKTDMTTASISFNYSFYFSYYIYK